jgi:hypothetical protein
MKRKVAKRKSWVHHEEIKRWSPGKLLNAVRLECKKQIASRNFTVVAEYLARQFKTTKGMITAALQKLGPEGIVGHKTKGYALWNRGKPSYYVLVDKRTEEEKEKEWEEKHGEKKEEADE